MAFEVLTLVFTSFFAGACVYVSFVEHPARLRLDGAAAVAQWRPSYKRAAAMQITLVIAGVLSAIAAFVSGQGRGVLAGGALLAAMAPFTLIVIMPTNRRLLDTSRPVDATTLALLQDWGRLHMVRTVGSLVAVAILTADMLRRF
ncbi:MAG TPA: DUF1772 domain-containing protein [Vicinamibacterales bacterium]|nr:DUF1772 domain-containing protein [Vicinamibacterales bacterium]